CYCDTTDVVVDEEPVYITSPRFPNSYCPNFRCKRQFRHSDTSREDVGYYFLVTVHFLSTEPNIDYIEFLSEGTPLYRFNGTHEDVRFVVPNDVMETVFVTDDSVEAHGYNMTVKSIRVPI
ncbi:CUB domain protein, partial [Ostertagia ostertagi]